MKYSIYTSDHWVPQNKLELHKQTLREVKLKD
jgi:hypothetical protein